MNTIDRLPLYPDTSFIDPYIVTAPETTLARSIIIVDHFSEGNPAARQWMSELANLEITAAPLADRKRVGEAVACVDGLIEKEFADILALGNDSYADLHVDEKQLAQKAETLTYTWECIKQSDRLTESYQIAQPFLKARPNKSQEYTAAIREVFGGSGTKDFRVSILCLGNTLLYLDSQRFGAFQNTATPTSPESRFRRVVCNNETTTGVGIFDRAFTLVRSLTRADFFAAGTDHLQEQWNHWNPETPFFSSGWTEGQRAVHRSARMDRAQGQHIWDETVAILHSSEAQGRLGSL